MLNIVEVRRNRVAPGNSMEGLVVRSSIQYLVDCKLKATIVKVRKVIY